MSNEKEYQYSFYENIRDLFPLYKQVRETIILLENFTQERTMYIAPINQLRSALDHIFKAVNSAVDTNHCQYELKEVKEHLDRAGYDALELLASNLGIKIIEKLKVYDTSTLSTIFPIYFTDIKPKLTDIKQAVAHLRSEKKIDSEKSFSDYFQQITVLVDIDKQVDRMIPSLEEYHQKRKTEEQEKAKNDKSKRRREIFFMIVGWVIALGIGIATLIFG